VPCAWLVVGLQLAIGLGLLVGYSIDNPRAILIDVAALAVGAAVYGVLRWWRRPGPEL
jgi:hypothetical protein